MLLLLLVLSGACAVDQVPQGAMVRGAAPQPRFATQLAGPSTFLAPLPTAVVILKPDDLAPRG